MLQSMEVSKSRTQLSDRTKSLSCVSFFCNLINCSPARLLWLRDFSGKNTGMVAISFSRRSFRPRDPSYVSCLAGGIFTTEPPGKPTISKITDKKDKLIGSSTHVNWLYSRVFESQNYQTHKFSQKQTFLTWILL